MMVGGLFFFSFFLGLNYIQPLKKLHHSCGRAEAGFFLLWASHTPCHLKEVAHLSNDTLNSAPASHPLSFAFHCLIFFFRIDVFPSDLFVILEKKKKGTGWYAMQALLRNAIFFSYRGWEPLDQNALSEN